MLLLDLLILRIALQWGLRVVHQVHYHFLVIVLCADARGLLPAVAPLLRPGPLCHHIGPLGRHMCRGLVQWDHLPAHNGILDGLSGTLLVIASLEKGLKARGLIGDHQGEADLGDGPCVAQDGWRRRQ